MPPISLVSTTTFSSSAAVLAVTIPAPADGNLLTICFASTSLVTPVSIVQAGASWAPATQLTFTSGSPFFITVSGGIWYAHSISSAGTLVTITFALPVESAVIIDEWADTAPVGNPIDRSTSGLGPIKVLSSGTTKGTKLSNELWLTTQANARTGVNTLLPPFPAMLSVPLPTVGAVNRSFITSNSQGSVATAPGTYAGVLPTFNVGAIATFFGDPVPPFAKPNTGISQSDLLKAVS